MLTNQAYPNIVPADGTTQALLTALVFDHDDNVPSNGVTIDLSLIGGNGSQPMFDDCTNGDEQVGDSVYSFQTTVSGGIGPGDKSLLITATDLD